MESGVEVSFRGSETREVECQVSLSENASKQAILIRRLPAFDLSLPPDVWSVYFRENLNSSARRRVGNEFCEIRQFPRPAGIGNVENTGALALPPETRARLRHDRPRLCRAPIFDRSAASFRRRPSLGRMKRGTRAPRSLVATPAASKPRRTAAGEPNLDQDRFAGPTT